MRSKKTKPEKVGDPTQVSRDAAGTTAPPAKPSPTPCADGKHIPMPSENWKWNDLADHLACACKACARARNLFGCIACYCPCHKYAFTPRSPQASIAQGDDGLDKASTPLANHLKKGTKPPVLQRKSMKSEKVKVPKPSSKSSARGETPPAKPSPQKALADGGEWTPGPWAYQERSDAYTHIVRGPNNVFLVHLEQSTTGRGEANAHLIAAAPELYAALSRYVEHYGDPLKVARAALAKARGESDAG